MPRHQVGRSQKEVEPALRRCQVSTCCFLFIVPPSSRTSVGLRSQSQEAELLLETGERDFMTEGAWRAVTKDLVR